MWRPFQKVYPGLLQMCDWLIEHNVTASLNPSSEMRAPCWMKKTTKCDEIIIMRFRIAHCSSCAPLKTQHTILYNSCHTKTFTMQTHIPNLIYCSSIQFSTFLINCPHNLLGIFLLSPFHVPAGCDWIASSPSPALLCTLILPPPLIKPPQICCCLPVSQISGNICCDSWLVFASLPLCFLASCLPSYFYSPRTPTRIWTRTNATVGTVAPVCFSQERRNRMWRMVSLDGLRLALWQHSTVCSGAFAPPTSKFHCCFIPVEYINENDGRCKHTRTPLKWYKAHAVAHELTGQCTFLLFT